MNNQYRLNLRHSRFNGTIKLIQEPGPKEKVKKMDLESWLKVLGLFATAISLFFTFRSIQNTQNWKVAEFTAAEFKKFNESHEVQVVSTLLDYNSRSVNLISDDSLTHITDDLLFEALVIDTIRGDFTPIEARVRDAFDEYFDRLAMFNKYLNANLISKEQMAPYIQYQLSILADEKNQSKSPELRHRIWAYIRYYKYADVLDLFQKFGYNIKA